MLSSTSTMEPDHERALWLDVGIPFFWDFMNQRMRMYVSADSVEETLPWLEKLMENGFAS